jgi:Cft2 family RNA processing exonuclease
MRPEAIRKARDEVHRILWTDPDHELVRWVREAILVKHQEVADEISSGNLLKGDRLGELLHELGTDGARLLAAVLWASEFDGPDAEELFRSLVPLAEDGASRGAGTAAGADDGQLKLLKAELRIARKELKQSTRAAEQAERALRLKERALARSRRELDEAQEKYRHAAEELGDVQARAREADTALRNLERDGQKAAKVNADLRRDLRRLQQAQSDLEIERSELARKLAAERRELERLKLALAGLPRGADAAWAFLRDEEDRIQADRVILAGGAKAAADKAWTAHRKLEGAFLDAYPSYREPPPVKVRRKTPLRLVTLGGSGEVGRSCYLVELGKHRILVDCGIKPSATEDLHPDIQRLDRIDALVLTHAHTDHIGWVPALVRKFGEFDIYCSDGTAALLPVMLEDIRGHYVRKMAARHKRAQYVQNAEIVEDEYEDEDVRDVPNLAIKCEFDEEEPLPFGDGSLRFYRAGHILGAASVLIEDQSGRRIFFSGDFSSFPQLTVPAASWPEDLEEIDLLVLESTYGGREPHPPLEQSRRELISFIRENIEGREGSVILASFALGRAQELLSLIAAARQSGELPASVPVHIDGMIKKINPIYRRLADFDISPDASNEVIGETERQEVALGAQKIPSIIVTTSGMLTGGPVVEYARRLLPDPRHRIVLTGYQDEGAPSRNLREIVRSRGGPRIVEVTDEDGELVQFEAALPAKEVRLSSHADQPGLLEYARRLRPRHIALVHGEPRAQEELRSRLLQIHPGAEISCGPSDMAVP